VPAVVRYNQPVGQLKGRIEGDSPTVPFGYSTHDASDAKGIGQSEEALKNKQKHRAQRPVFARRWEERTGRLLTRRTNVEGRSCMRSF
jgi:hypothetical protein